MKYLLFFIITAICGAASCNKEQLPKYYFKCKVDGQEYTPDNCTNCLQANLLQDTILILGGTEVGNI